MTVSYKRHEVFVVGGQPTVTYNPRPDQKAESVVRDYLNERGRILCITGPTKAGKTVLVREVVPEALRLSGGELASVEDFWLDVVEEMRRNTAFEPPHGPQTANAARRVAKGELLSNPRPLVLDDFHHIAPDIQQAIVRGLKDLVFEKVPVIFLAVPHRSADVVKAEPEMNGRVEQIAIKPWSMPELEEIATQGFAALNIDCPLEMSTRMATESYGSPHLMQDFCLQICKANGVEATLSSRAPLVGDMSEEFFEFVARNSGASDTYRRLAQGPRQRTDRIKRRLRVGEVTDIYGAVLHAIAHTGPKTELDWTEVRAALRQVLADEPPQRHEYTRVLEQMSAIAKDLVWDENHQRFTGDPVLEFDPELGKVHISDPFFAYQLRWSQR